MSYSHTGSSGLAWGPSGSVSPSEKPLGDLSSRCQTSSRVQHLGSSTFASPVCSPAAVIYRCHCPGRSIYYPFFYETGQYLLLHKKGCKIFSILVCCIMVREACFLWYEPCIEVPQDCEEVLRWDVGYNCLKVCIELLNFLNWSHVGG